MTLLLTLEEAADLLHPTVTSTELSECITKLAIPEILIGAKIFYHEDDIKVLINSLKKQDQLITKDLILSKYGCDTLIIEHENGDLEWQDNCTLCHLVREGVELTHGIKAQQVIVLSNEAWGWKDIYGWWHLILDSTEVTDSINAKEVTVFSSIEWAYKDEDDWWHLFLDSTELTDGLNAKEVTVFSSIEWAYKDEDDWWHLFQNSTELTDGLNAKAVLMVSSMEWAYKDEDDNWITMTI